MDVLKFHEFFAGAGLVRLGLQPEWKCVWANDIDPKKGAIYKHNFGGDELLVEDVSRVDANSITLPVDMAWASFPCQDLSLAGWRRGMSAARSGTFWAFWNIMRDLFDDGNRPPIIVLENVTGLLYGDNFSALCEALAALGMQFGALVIDAKHFLPQSRPRVFVVAVDSAVDCTRFEEVLPGESPWFNKAIRAAYGKLPKDIVGLWRWWKLPVPTREPDPIWRLMEEEPTGVQWHTDEQTKALLDLMTPTNLEKVRAAMHKDGRSVGFLYKRTRQGTQRAEVRFDGYAGCLRTPQGGSSRQLVIIVENGRVRSRLLSPREAARLMGVPDSYILPDSYNDAYKAMGDGVAVPVVRWLASHLLTPLARACRSVGLDQNKSLDSGSIASLLRSRENAEMLAAKWYVS